MARSPRTKNALDNNSVDFRFESAEQAHDYLLKVGLSTSQVATLVAHGEAGLAIATALQALKVNSWLMEDRTLARREICEPRSTLRSATTAAGVLTTRPMLGVGPLADVVAFGAFVHWMLDSASQFVEQLRAIQALLERNAELVRLQRSWSSEQQLFLASLLAAGQSIGIDVTTRQVEALAIIVGFRQVGEDLPWRPRISMDDETKYRMAQRRLVRLENRERVWRDMKRKVAPLISCLRDFRLSE